MRILFADDTDISLNGDIDFSGLQELGEYQSLPNGAVAEIIEHGVRHRGDRGQQGADHQRRCSRRWTPCAWWR